MKLLFLIFLLVSTRANAGVRFTYSETPEYAKPKLIDLLEVQTELEEQGYFPVDLSHEQKLQGIGADQIFFDATTSKLVILKFGQRVSDPSLVGQLISMNGDYLFHGENVDKVPYALYFIGHRESEARNALSELGIKKSISFLSLLIPDARAACSSSALAAMGTLSMTVSSPLILQKLWNCGLAAGTAAHQTVEGFAKGLKSFVTDPTAFWKSAGKATSELWQFVKRIHLEVGKLVQAIGGLDFETGFQIGCTLAGKLIPSLLIGWITGGAAAAVMARTLPLLSYQLQKVRSMSSVLRVLSKQRQAGRLKNADEAIERVVSCAR